MADIGHELTDGLLDELEKRIKEEYEKAVADAERNSRGRRKNSALFTRPVRSQKPNTKTGATVT